MPNPVRALSVSSILALAAAFGAGLLAAPHFGVVQAQTAAKVFELRTYTAPEGKLADLHKRFRDHTLRIFQKHGMTNVVYLSPRWMRRCRRTRSSTCCRIRAAKQAKKSWAAFGADPEWKKVAAESQVNGRILEKVESVFLHGHRLFADEVRSAMIDVRSSAGGPTPSSCQPA